MQWFLFILYVYILMECWVDISIRTFISEWHTKGVDLSLIAYTCPEKSTPRKLSASASGVLSFFVFHSFYVILWWRICGEKLKSGRVEANKSATTTTTTAFPPPFHPPGYKSSTVVVERRVVVLDVRFDPDRQMNKTWLESQGVY